jgi:hypothetical protein
MRRLTRNIFRYTKTLSLVSGGNRVFLQPYLYENIIYFKMIFHTLSFFTITIKTSEIQLC